jgi:CBS domain-containing protein
MKIRDVMNRKVASCSVEESCQEAARAMRDRKVGFVVVKAAGGMVAGVITDRDICLAAASRRKLLSEIPVKSAMTKKVHSCSVDSELTAAHVAMRTHRVRRLPVLEADGSLAGVVSLSDLALEAHEVAPFTASPDVATTLAELAVPGASGHPGGRV